MDASTLHVDTRCGLTLGRAGMRAVVVAVTHAADPQCIDDEMAMLRVLHSPLTYVGMAAVRG